MEKQKNPVRTTVYLDEEILCRCQILFGEAKTDSLSDFVRKALLDDHWGKEYEHENDEW